MELLSKGVDMRERTTVKVSKRYQIAVPRAVRRLLNIQSGDQLLVDVQDNMVILMPMPKDHTQALAGLHREIWQGVDAAVYLREEREAWDPSPKS